MTKELIFDTETTGLVPKGLNYKTDYEGFPNIVQIAWLFEGELKDYIIFPEDWVISDEVAKIHGITQDIALRKGHYFNDVLIEFISDCTKAEKIIAHNIYFDTSIIKANILRAMPDSFALMADSALDKSKRICTMMKTIKFIGAKQKDSNRLKFPTLLELYDKLFEEKFPAHDAGEDVKATKRCFDELVKLRVIE